MPQSLANVLLHIVFSTKERRPFLKTPELRSTMTAYLVGILRNLNCPSIIIGVLQDHVHILCHLSRTITIANLIAEIKGSSSERIKQEGQEVAGFYWQNCMVLFPSVNQWRLSSRITLPNRKNIRSGCRFRTSFGTCLPVMEFSLESQGGAPLALGYRLWLLWS